MIRRNEQVQHIRDQDLLSEVKGTLSLVCSKMAVPLYLVFWVADLIYAPEHKWTFLVFRILTAVGIVSIYRWIHRTKSFTTGLNLSLILATLMSVFINIMIFMTDGGNSPYYAGLNLVAAGMLAFIPWPKKYFALAAAVIYGPFYAGSIYLGWGAFDFKLLAINSFFVVGTVVISLVIRYFYEQIRLKEAASRLALEEEIENRGRIIEKQTEQAIKLKTLSAQFSPQVVHAIKSGQFDIKDGIHRAKICAIFIDIVNSTQRVTRIDKDHVDQVIKMFMEDSMKILLKYDITIDKFLGDGVLGFSNDPMPYEDFVERTVKAALEIRSRIEANQEAYEDYWLNKMEIRIGVASGYANVGFYGSDHYFKSYTAIGPVVNMASRLCAEAKENQILISPEVARALETADVEVSFVGKKTLKGFEGDIIKVYEVNGGKEKAVDGEVLECPKCPGSILYLDTNASGFFAFKCRTCGYEMESPDDQSLAA